ncbi:MAG: type II secretion system protein GspG [Planctomycetes bacterium]|nr:type II secretion system protein GspG [Planctomycetota bacterium]
MSRREEQAGFTLVEWVVACAVVAVLGGLLLPGFTSRLSAARVSAAERDVSAIGNAIRAMHRQLGVWPARNGAGVDHSLTLLLSGSALPGANPWADTSFWSMVTGSSADVLDHHLAANTPQGSAGAGYPTAGFAAWHGPYLESIPRDPWGRPYVVNVQSGYATHPTQARRLWVLSAGPDGQFQTSASAGVADVCVGDDVGFLVYLR